jgi:hypothetical protein
LSEKLSGVVRVVMPEGLDMTDYNRTAREDKIRITRYRKLEREVTDPFAVCLLRIVVEELEVGLLSEDRQEAVPS